jgi:hypothetical protein
MDALEATVASLFIALLKERAPMGGSHALRHEIMRLRNDVEGTSYLQHDTGM